MEICTIYYITGAAIQMETCCRGRRLFARQARAVSRRIEVICIYTSLRSW